MIAAHRIAAKLFLADAPEDLQPVLFTFHRFIRQRSLDEMLIDVADYRHVHDGPGVLLVAHEANYTVDSTLGRMGLTYARKREDGERTLDARLVGALKKVLTCARKLEEELGLQFRGEELHVQVNDRLLAPNTAATFEEIAPSLRALCERLYAGAPVTHVHLDDPARPFAVEIASSHPVDVATLLSRIQ